MLIHIRPDDAQSVISLLLNQALQCLGHMHAGPVYLLNYPCLLFKLLHSAIKALKSLLKDLLGAGKVYPLKAVSCLSEDISVIEVEISFFTKILRKLLSGKSEAAAVYPAKIGTLKVCHEDLGIVLSHEVLHQLIVVIDMLIDLIYPVGTLHISGLKGPYAEDAVGIAAGDIDLIVKLLPYLLIGYEGVCKAESCQLEGL